MNVMGARIKELRLKKGMTQDQLAEILGVNRANISNYERGQVTNIPSDKLDIMADLFNADVDYIMGRSKDRVKEDKSEYYAHTNKDENNKQNLTEEEILTLAAHQVGHEGKLTEEQLAQIKLAMKIALAKNDN